MKCYQVNLYSQTSIHLETSVYTPLLTHFESETNYPLSYSRLLTYDFL